MPAPLILIIGLVLGAGLNEWASELRVRGNLDAIDSMIRARSERAARIDQFIGSLCSDQFFVRYRLQSVRAMANDLGGICAEGSR